VDEDSEEGPGDGDGSCDVAFACGERVSGGGGFEEEETDEDEDFCPDTCGVGEGVDAKRFKEGEDDEDGCETVVEREGELDPELIIDVLSRVMFLDDIVNMAHAAAHEESEDEGDDIMLAAPDVDVNTSEDGEEWETPADAIDNSTFSGGEELVDHITEKEEMDQRPDKECPRCGGKVGLFSGMVDTWSRDGVNVRAKEEYVDDDVHDLEEDTIFPIVRHC